jgi:hypothetical protein
MAVLFRNWRENPRVWGDEKRSSGEVAAVRYGRRWVMRESESDQEVVFDDGGSERGDGEGGFGGSRCEAKEFREARDDGGCERWEGGTAHRGRVVDEEEGVVTVEEAEGVFWVEFETQLERKVIEQAALSEEGERVRERMRVGRQAKGCCCCCHRVRTRTTNDEREEGRKEEHGKEVDLEEEHRWW